MTNRIIPPGAKCLTASESWLKLARKHSWFWAQVKNDPDFPKPIYIGARPVFIESELDAWLQRQAQLTAERAA